MDDYFLHTPSVPLLSSYSFYPRADSPPDHPDGIYLRYFLPRLPALIPSLLQPLGDSHIILILPSLPLPYFLSYNFVCYFFLSLQRLLPFHLSSLRFLRLLLLFTGSLLLDLLLHHITPRLPSPLLPTLFLLLLVIRPWTLAPLLLLCLRLMSICYLWLKDFLLHFPAPLLSSPPSSLPLLTVIRTSLATSLPSLPSPAVMLPPLCPTLLPPLTKLFLSTSIFLRCPLLLSSIVCLLRTIHSPPLLPLPSCRHFLLPMSRLPRMLTLTSSRYMPVMVRFLYPGYFMLRFFPF